MGSTLMEEHLHPTESSTPLKADGYSSMHVII